MPNRFMLAPLTNKQSHEDGTLSEDEYRWLMARAESGFGLTMTCAAHVQAVGKGFSGQLGIWSDAHLPGLARIADGIRKTGGRSAVQLHHAGERAAAELTGTLPHVARRSTKAESHYLTTGEVEKVAEDFIAAAIRAEKAGFDGVELHGAHGYLLCHFLAADPPERDDRYGGSYDNRKRLLFDIIAGVRAATRPDFQLGVRISPERYGMATPDAIRLAGELLTDSRIDFLDVSLWDVTKLPNDETLRDKPLIRHFTDLPRGETRLGVAGKIMGAPAAQWCLDQGADFAIIGRGAILHHDFPRRALADPTFESIPLPVSRDYLTSEALGPAFIEYMATNWSDFVAA